MPTNRRYIFPALLIGVTVLAGFVRLAELRTYGPTPGDDISYLNGVRDEYAAWREGHPGVSFGKRLLGAFTVANRLTQRSYRSMAFTSLAKPLYMLKLALIEGTVGLDLYRQQLSLALVGIGAVLVMFSIGRRLFGPGAGLISAFLMAISPWAVRYSTYGVPTMDSLFLLLLSFRVLIARRPRMFLTGLLLGATLILNPTVAWPVAILASLGACRWWLECAALCLDPSRPRAGRVWRGWLWLGLGLAAVPLLWEIGNLIDVSSAGLSYRPFWTALGQTAADNTLHAMLLPVDHIFWLRLIAATEGYPQLILWLASLVWLIILIARCERPSRFLPFSLLIAVIGTIAAATWSGSTQCARHYALAWALGLIMVGGMAAPGLTGLARVLSVPRLGGRNRLRDTVAGALVALLLFAGTHSAFFRLGQYRYSRQGGYRLAHWIAENAPAGRVVAPANQPAKLWPEAPRFRNWDELKLREQEEGPVYVVYGDYLAITRGIWDYPFEMFQIAQACRAIEKESFRAGTHLSAPSFLFENEDYYWGFVRQKKEAFDPDVRVIPAADILAFRAAPPRPPDSEIIEWWHADGGHGYNVYWPFISFAVHSHRSAWPCFWSIIGGLIAALYVCGPDRLQIREAFRGHAVGFALAGILLLTLMFRTWGLGRFSQMGGDDVEYRVYVTKGRTFPKFQGRGLLTPFILASQLTQLDVNKTVTSFAKPLFLLERCLLEYAVVGSPVFLIHLWTCLQGVATVLVIFFLGKDLGGKWAGLAAAALWAVSPWAVTYSTWGIHVAGAALWFALALWIYLRCRSNFSPLRTLVAGILLGVCFLYSSSDLWPVFCLILIDAAWRVCRLLKPEKRGARGTVLLGWLCLLGGAGAVWAGWEILSWGCARMVNGDYLSFPRVLLNTMRDNLLHASALPVDPLFFWRHLFVSEGVLPAIGLIAAGLWALWRVVRRRAGEVEGFLLALAFGCTVTVNYAGGSQVIRHFFPVWVPLTALFGLGASRVIARFRWTRWAAAALLLALIPAQWHRLETFRLARWAPDRVWGWAQINFVPESVATLACQDMSLWPGLRPITSWGELREVAKRIPPGVLMYSDYIEIAHGSWFYTLKDSYEISEVARNFPAERYRTPSYLSYLPARFENEFYYWGLFREPFAQFDPAIRILPAPAVISFWDEIRADPQRLDELWEPSRRPPPLRLPARPDDIQRPFLAPRLRPSYRIHLILTFILLLFLSFWGQCRPREESR